MSRGFSLTLSPPAENCHDVGTYRCNKYDFLDIRPRSEVPLRITLASHETKYVARILANICLAFGIPTSVATAEENFGQKSRNPSAIG